MKRTYIYLYTILAALTVFLSSCLKSEKTFTDFSKAGTLVELPLAAYKGLNKTAPVALPIQAAAQTIPVVINVASPVPLSTSLKVTLKVDEAALTALNNKNIAQYKSDSTAAANDTTGATAAPDYPVVYDLMPTAFYSISSLIATVPANQRTATINVSVITQNFDLEKAYVLPISIVDASGQQISNYKTLFLNIQAKNKYDGIYTVKGIVHRDADTQLGGHRGPGATVSLATTGANSVSYAPLWADNKTGIGGIDGLNIVINPTTNKVSFTDSNATLVGEPGYDTRYDPATKTFYISMLWNGADINHRGLTDTLTYSKARP
ncbi:protein of unknown function [Mucilaginibacter gossypiicola]|uniref:BT-3987-like N-terminal domain-containing protein n=1 Tax=Mucilaginibacter gossypiicola TaxID=551995 RepID=A0A1H8E6E9_9SPHI|nr:DUF1735 domain-containing protein [Mucilaginibacter gossypiicola]SEN15151.1 protein of unknown function [Mucilaginibacter gossypiicola]